MKLAGVECAAGKATQVVDGSGRQPANDAPSVPY